MPNTWGQGSTRGSRRARATALERDNYTCQLRLPGCTGQASIADHIINLAAHGVSRAEAIDPDELHAVCPHCHQHKTKHETAAGRTKSNAKRAARKKLPAKPHPGN